LFAFKEIAVIRKIELPVCLTATFTGKQNLLLNALQVIMGMLAGFEKSDQKKVFKRGE
jgi:hypothetical protein